MVYHQCCVLIGWATTCSSLLVATSAGFEHKKMAAESCLAEVSDEFLSSLLDKSIPKSTKKSTKYGMKIFNGRNALI